MRRRLIAGLFGLIVASIVVGFSEHWQRDHELGTMQVDFDPPGLKYSLSVTEEDYGRGWREDRVPPPRKEGVTRIVCLGDSVTYGVNVGSRDTWCEQLRVGLGAAEA